MRKNCIAGKLYRTFRTAELLANYKRLSTACSDSLEPFQNQFENKLVNCGNLGAFYKYVSTKMLNAWFKWYCAALKF
jgi:hypothetical protein